MSDHKGRDLCKNYCDNAGTHLSFTDKNMIAPGESNSLENYCHCQCKESVAQSNLNCKNVSDVKRCKKCSDYSSTVLVPFLTGRGLKDKIS